MLFNRTVALFGNVFDYILVRLGARFRNRDELARFCVATQLETL